jgi:hypothetical protein
MRNEFLNSDVPGYASTLDYENWVNWYTQHAPEHFDPEGAQHFAKAKDWTNGMMVRLEEPTYGILEGKSEQHGAGRYKEIPAGSIGECLGADDVPVLGTIVDCIFAGPCKNNGPMEPYHVRAHIEEKHLTVAGWVKAPGPFVKRTEG